MSLSYNQLQRLAHRNMAAQPSRPSLQTTALIHEVYLPLVDVDDVDWQMGAHLYAFARLKDPSPYRPSFFSDSMWSHYSLRNGSSGSLVLRNAIESRSI